MQKVVTYEKVAFACTKLKQEGERITGRNVLAITGGDFGSVLKYIKQWKEQDDETANYIEKIPDNLQEVIVQALWQAGQDAVAQTQQQIKQLCAAEKEAVDALCRSEETLKELQFRYEDMRQSYEMQIHQLKTDMALMEEKLRVSHETNQSLKVNIDEKSNQLASIMIQLAEMRQVTKCSESTVVKVEEKMEQMQHKMETLTQENYRLQKEVAIAAQRLKLI